MPVKSVFRPNLGDLFDVTSSAGFGADASPLVPAPRPSNTPQRAFPFLPSPMGRARDVVMESGASSLLAALSPANAATPTEFTFATPKQAAKSPKACNENAGVNADAAEPVEPACDTPPLLLNTAKVQTPAVAHHPAPPPAPAASPAAVSAPVVECEPVAPCAVAVVEAAPVQQVEEVKPVVAKAVTPVPPKTASRRRGATPAARTRKAGNSGDDESEDVEPSVAPAPMVTPARVTRSSARAAAAGAAVTPAAPAVSSVPVAAKTPKTGGRRTAGKAQRVAVLPAADVPAAVEPPAAVTGRAATASAFKDPYSAEALAELMSNPILAFKSGPKAMQNSPVQAPPAGRTPRAARKKTAEERHAECWVADE